MLRRKCKEMKREREREKATETRYFRREFRQSSSRAHFSLDPVELAVPPYVVITIGLPWNGKTCTRIPQPSCEKWAGAQNGSLKVLVSEDIC